MRGPKVHKLSDEFGQYELVLTCRACGHERRCTPNLVAKISGWDTRLEDLSKRMRCSKCGKRSCSAEAKPLLKPRDWHDLRR